MQIHDETDLVSPLLASDIEVTLVDPCQSATFDPHIGIDDLNTMASDLQAQLNVQIKFTPFELDTSAIAGASPIDCGLITY